MFENFLNHQNYKDQSVNRERSDKKQAIRVEKLREIMNSSEQQELQKAKTSLHDIPKEYNLYNVMSNQNMNQQQKFRHDAEQASVMNLQE